MEDILKENLENKHHGLLWGVRRSIRYHSHRQDFFEQCNTWSNVIALLFGSGAIFTILKDYPSIAITLAAMVTVVSTVNLVINTTRKAQVHRDFYKQFHELEATLTAGSPTEEMVNKATVKRLEIEAEEPPVLQVLDILCHNELLRSKGYDPVSDASQYYKVSPLQRAFAQIVDLCPGSIDKVGTSSPKPSAC